MATRIDYYITNQDTGHAIGGNNWEAQTFTASESYNISAVKLQIQRSAGTTPGIVTVSIRAVDGSNHPVLPDLAVGTTNGDTLPEVPNTEWRTIVFTSVAALTNGQMYAIVMRSAANFSSWRADASTPLYANGQREHSLGGAGANDTWTGDIGDDYMFETYDDTGAGASSPSTDKTYSKQLIAIGNNEVWRQTDATTMSEFTDANGGVNTANPLTCCEAFQKLFIANTTNLRVADFINTKLTTATAPTNNPNPGTILTGDDSSASMIVDYVAPDAKTIYGKRTTVATFQAEVISGTDDAGNDIDFTTSIVETDPPHWYDWTVFGNVADADKYGVMPTSAYLVCRYRGRLVLSGDPNYPHQWYMSKIGFPFNFLYGTNDPMTAVAGTNANAGELGDIVRALIPFGDDFLVFACANSIHLLDGDPAAGGSIDELDNKTGIFGPWAWCIDGVGDLWFYGTGGLYKMVGGRSRPINISQSHIPQLIDTWAAIPGTHRIILTYDPFRNGVIISRTTLADGTNLNYWYDLKTEGFYPESYPTACGIFSSCYYDSDVAATKGLVLGCNDGYIRNFYDADKNDDIGATNRQISSYATWPIQHLTEDNDREGKLTSLTIELAGGAANGDFGDTDEVDYEIHVADDAETCLEKIKDGDTPFTSGTLTGTGRKVRIRTKVRGAYLGLKFYNVITTTDWATATDYVVDDLVVYLNIEYICIVAHTSEAGGGTHEEPDTNTTDWTATTAQTWSINRVFGEIKPAGKIK